MYYARFNFSKWTQSTRGLLPEEEGVYIRLISHYYDTEKPIPLDLRKTLKRLNLIAYKEITESVLNDYFKKTRKGWVHNYCDQILDEFHKICERNKINGMKGGRPRKTKALSETEPKPSGLPPATEPEPIRNPSITDSRLPSNLVTYIPSTGFDSKTLLKETRPPVAGENAVSTPAVPFEKIIKKWNCEAKKQGLPQVVKTTTTLKGQIRARWADIPSLEQWDNFIATIMRNNFLSGKAPPGHNRSTPFRATLPWVTKEANFAKIAAGEYD